MGNMIKETWLVLVLSILFGLALAFTDRSTAKRIEQNRQRQIRELSQLASIGELEYDNKGKPKFKIELKELSELKKQGLVAYEIHPIGSKKVIGYSLIAEGIGWDRLKILIALSSDLQKITGLEIVDSRETPGLGARIKEDWFRKQFQKPTDRPLQLVKHKPSGKYQVQAITGATISSTAVTNMVNKTVALARKLIKPKK